MDVLLLQESLTEGDVRHIADALGDWSLSELAELSDPELGREQAMNEKREAFDGAFPVRLLQVFEEAGRHQPYDSVALARNWFRLPLAELLEITKEPAGDLRLMLRAADITGRIRSRKDMVRAIRTWWVHQLRDGLRAVEA